MSAAYVLVGIHHQHNVSSILLPFVNRGSKIVEYQLSRFLIDLAKLEEVLSLLNLDRLHLYGVLEVWAVGRNDLE